MQEATLEILNAANPSDVERWSRFVANSPSPDVYYLPEYAQATAETEHAEPIAVIAGNASCKLLAPLLLRRMSAVVNGATITWMDACSPYGYGGLLPLSGCQPNDMLDFFNSLHTWCSDRAVVCSVIRLHPLLKQNEWFTQRDLECIKPQLRRTTTAIDLKDWEPRCMRRGRRSDLNLACKTLRVTWTDGEDPEISTEIARFSALYEKSMEAHSAEEFYRFPRAYFCRLSMLGRAFAIVSAWMEDQYVGASIFLASREYAHYHLAAVNEAGFRHKASTLLVVEGARWARERECRLLHLGGGLRPGDSLEDFKLSFGGQSYQYAYLVYVADKERFEQFCRMPNAPWPYCSFSQESRVHGEVLDTDKFS